ncbi:MAG: NAD(+)/NADH kinase [Lachnospiraceae bacterium]|nr:NAD(+)/NADH kinase [Lachnospiraceae bacterium]
MRIVIYPNTYKDKDGAMTQRVRAELTRLGIEHFVFPHGEIRDGDLMLVLGGDGTVLQAARQVKEYMVPMIGVNMGTLGYLTEIEPSRIEEALQQIVRGDYTVQLRMMLNGQVFFPSGNRAENWALNDIVISRCGSLQILALRIFVNGLFLHDYYADGVILTTPTGSTGYNLSAGGPIMEPGANMITLTPICPHTLNQRSIVLSAEDEIVVEVLPGKDGSEQNVEASFDGTAGIKLRTGDKIRVVRSEKTTELIRLEQTSFLNVLQEKL